MRRSGTALVVLALAVGCSAKDTSPGRSDTLLTRPVAVDTHTVPTLLPNGLVIDSSQILSADRENAMARFTPKQVLAVYQAFRPLRRTELTQSQLDTFLTRQKISLTELHAILEQGDRLGWNTPSR